MADKGCIFNLDDDPAGLTWWSTSLAIVPSGKTIPSGVEGNFFVIDAKVSVHSAAFVMEFTQTDDSVILGFKVNGSTVYAVGIPVPKLMAWNPPADKSKLCEDTAMLTLFKLPHSGMTKMRALSNTDTAKLRDKAEALLPFVPLFKFAGIRSLKILTDVSSETAPKNLSRAIGAAALRWKKAAAARGRTTGADSESVAGGESASGLAKQLEVALLPSMKYYDEVFDNRFITLTTNEGKLTEKSFDDARQFLRSQEHDHEKELTLKLNEMQEAAAELDVLLANFVEKPSPLAKQEARSNAPAPADEPRGARVRTAPQRFDFDQESPAKSTSAPRAEAAAEEAAAAAEEAAAPEAAESDAGAGKRGRGRPPGAPNKKQAGEGVDDEDEDQPPAKAGKRSTAEILPLQKCVASAEKRLAARDLEISELKSEAKNLKADEKTLRGQLEEQIRKNGMLTAEVKQIKQHTELQIENAVNKAKMQSLFYFIQKKFNISNSGSSSGCETPQTPDMPIDRNMAAFFMGSGGFD